MPKALKLQQPGVERSDTPGQRISPKIDPEGITAASATPPGMRVKLTLEEHSAKGATIP